MTINNQKNWWMYSYSISNIKIRLCLESPTFEIKTWWVGNQNITVQNFIRKLEEAIQQDRKDHPNKFILILAEDPVYSNSKAYKEFFKRHSEGCQGKLISEMPKSLTVEKESLHKIVATFQTSQWNGKRFQQILQEKIDQKVHVNTLVSIVGKYVQDWNQNLIAVESRGEKQPFQNLKLVKVTDQYKNLVSKTSDNLLTVEEKSEISYISHQMRELTNIVANSTYLVADFVDQKAQELSQQIDTVDQKVNEMSGDVKQLLPSEKRKHNPRALRDPIHPDVFQLLIFNAGSNARYQKRIRRAQLRIAYTLLYHLGLRLNEIRPITLDQILEALERSELRVTLFKTNRPHNMTLSISARTGLEEIKSDITFLQSESQFLYLFGKRSYPHEKTLLRIVNQDLANTCQLCHISANIKSHSFRVSVIARLLRVTSVQNVASIIGHQDIRSTMQYSRYRLSKSAIQDIHQKAEDAFKENSW